jgi:hypothetical protein
MASSFHALTYGKSSKTKRVKNKLLGAWLTRKRDLQRTLPWVRLGTKSEEFSGVKFHPCEIYVGQGPRDGGKQSFTFSWIW